MAPGECVCTVGDTVKYRTGGTKCTARDWTCNLFCGCDPEKEIMLVVAGAMVLMGAVFCLVYRYVTGSLF